MLKRVLCVVILVGCAPALAVECPKDVNPCKVVFYSPQQLQWLSGTKETSSGSLLDAAVKSIGSDGAGVVAQVLMRARQASDGEAPKEPPKVETPAVDPVPQPPADDLVRRIKPEE